MIVVDTSCLVAVIEGEAEAVGILERIRSDEAPLISAGTLIEASVVLLWRKTATVQQVGHWLDDFVVRMRLDVVPVTATQARIAREAYARFGKGSGHPAQLNFGDCFTYALAKERGAPVLFKGDDFRHTDLSVA